MATLVKFLKAKGEVFAYFPQLNWNKPLYGNTTKVSYSHIGQHSSCSKLFAKKDCKKAEPKEYNDLLCELQGIGYNLKVL